MRAPAETDPVAPPGGTAAGGGARAARWRDLRKRVLSAALLAPAALLCVWLGAEAWTALMAAAAAVLAWEWVRLCGYSTRRLPGVGVPLAVLAAGTLAVEAQWLQAIALLCFGAVAVSALSGPAPMRGAAGTAGNWLGFGVLYIGLAAVALIHLRGDAAAGRLNVLFLFFTVWASDIGAYAAGRWLGGPKLAPSVSPNKTWSGAVGGLLSAVAVGTAAAYLMEAAGTPAPTGRVLLVAGGVGVLAQAGDFFESWIKRRFDVKDSSTLIPGHGGLLDRLDGVLAAAPAAAVLGVLLGPGEALWR